MISTYLEDLWSELCRPQVLLGLVLFIAGVAVLWHAWKDRATPVPFGVLMPF